MDGGKRDAGKEGKKKGGAGWEKNREEKEKEKEKERKGKIKERKKEGKERKKERKERREGGGRPWPTVAGGGRSWPEKVAKAPSPSKLWGASVVKMRKMEFCKRVSESEIIARWKEYDEERKMAWLVVTKVV